MSFYCKREDIFGLDYETKLIDLPLFKKLEKASRLLGQVNNHISVEVFQHDFIISTLKNIESLESAKIEGTTGNLEDLYKYDDLDFNQKKELKLFSAINYRRTIDKLEDISQGDKDISIRLIRETHQMLTMNDPATAGSPGVFRTKDVKIRNNKLGDFYPPSHMIVNDLMLELIDFSKILIKVPDLIKIAILHYQFESIHPFEDGNGRTGRLLINLNFLQNELLSKPILNLSEFFENNREDYIYYLRSVSDNKTYIEWLDFFLEGVIQQSVKVMDIILGLKKIREENIDIIHNNKKHTLSIDILDYALKKLFISVPEVVEHLKERNIVFKSLDQMVRSEVKRMVSLGLLKKADFRRGRSDIYLHNALADFLFKPSR